jgi:hypothetical protein
MFLYDIECILNNYYELHNNYLIEILANIINNKITVMKVYLSIL